MVSNLTIETINYAKDIDMDYNAKLFVLCLGFIYVCFCLWYSFKIEDDTYWKKLFKYVVLRLPSLVFFFFYPLFGLFLLRGVEFIFLWKTLLTIYIVLITFIGFIWIIWHGEFTANLIGLTYKNGRGFRKTRRDND